MINFPKLKQDISSLFDSSSLREYLDTYLYDIEIYFESITKSELNSIKFDLQELIYDMIDKELFSCDNDIVVDDFLLILGEFAHKAKLRSLTIELVPLLPPNIPLAKRLVAQLIWLKVNSISTEYHKGFNQILSLLDSTYTKEPLHKSIDALLSFYTYAMGQFIRTDRGDLAHSFSLLFLSDGIEYKILKDPQIISNLSKSKQKFKFQRYQEDKHLKDRGEKYERFIGKEYESRDDLVIYNGLIKGNQDRGVDIISISLLNQNIKIIQCKNWIKRRLKLEDITKIYNKLQNYTIDFYFIDSDIINSHLHTLKAPSTIEEIITHIDDFKLTKILHFTSIKTIDLHIKEIESITPNSFRYKDMEIVIWSYFE
ncbi:MAG: hypothetical protein QM493_05890 [Sulfurovum sp.]